MGTMFLCVYDNDYEVCSETEITIDPVNDAPLILSDMSALVGRGLEFNFELEGEDIESDSLIFVFAGEVGGGDFSELGNCVWQNIVCACCLETNVYTNHGTGGGRVTN